MNNLEDVYKCLRYDCGFKDGKITANRELISAVVGIVAEDKNLSPVLEQAIKETHDCLKKAKETLEEAEDKMRQVRREEWRHKQIEQENVQLNLKIDAITQAETDEMRDRYRAALIFKTECEGLLKSTANNSMYIHGMSEILCGHSIPFGDVKEDKNVK